MSSKLQKFDGDLLVDFVVFCKKNPQRVKSFPEDRFRRLLLAGCSLIGKQSNSEMKGTAQSDLAFDPDAPTHQLDQL